MQFLRKMQNQSKNWPGVQYPLKTDVCYRIFLYYSAIVWEDKLILRWLGGVLVIKRAFVKRRRLDQIWCEMVFVSTFLFACFVVVVIVVFVSYFCFVLYLFYFLFWFCLVVCLLVCLFLCFVCLFFAFLVGQRVFCNVAISTIIINGPVHFCCAEVAGIYIYHE